MPDVIATHRLTKYYNGHCAVDSLNLRVAQGTVYGLLGRNGAGKTTAIKMLLGMAHPSCGRAEVLGEDSLHLRPETRARIAYLAEGHPLYRWMTIRQAVEFTRAFYARWNQQLLEQILDHFELSPKRRIRRLSRGQQAQVALALAVATDPEVLILDDPTLGLDTVVRRDFLESLIQIIQRRGRTILFSSHILGDVERVADRIGILVDGVLRVDCPTDHFKDSVRKVLLEFDGQPPAAPDCPGLVNRRQVGRKLELVVVGLGETHRELFDSLHPRNIEVIDFNLEDAFIEYTRGPCLEQVGDWSIFRREDVFCRRTAGRKHGPVPLGGARGTVPFSRRQYRSAMQYPEAPRKLGQSPVNGYVRDWSIFRREDVFCRRTAGRKHGPVPLGDRRWPMFRAMALKELRETRGITLLALAAYALLVAAEASPWGVRQRYWPPFVNDSLFFGWFICISAAMAIALGLRQTLGESIPGTYPFLFHRPADRRWLIGVKLLTGSVLYLVCAAVPIVAYGIWAATPGTHPSPFAWSMTAPAWYLWLGMTLVYLGAFLAGVRPGRWYRSRILPLAAGGFAMFMASVAFFELNEPLWPCWIIVAIDVWMVSMVLFVVQTRDYP